MQERGRQPSMMGECVPFYYCVHRYCLWIWGGGVGEKGERERKGEGGREGMCVFVYVFLSLDFYGVWRDCVVCDMVRRQDVTGNMTQFSSWNDREQRPGKGLVH